MADDYRVYGYRWVVLAVTMAVNVTIQILWITYASITSEAASYYHVSTLAIGIFSMTFMIAYIPLSLPSAWLIDTKGFRFAMGLGVVLMGVFGVVRGLAGANYTVALLATIGLAIAQPFLMNAWTTVPAKWFPMDERATGVGLITLASLIGTAVGLVLTPALRSSLSISSVQLVYGLAAAAAACAFLVLAREHPPTPPCPPGFEERALVLDGLKHALKVRPFLIYLAVVFVGMGIFNGVTTWVEQIIKPRGFTSGDAGLLGALLLLGGVLGAVVMSALSDRQHKRIRYLVIGLAVAAPALLVVTYATSLPVLFAGAFVLGFFLISVSPIGMQFSAEVTYPTPEGTSNGLIQLFGQSAVVWVYLMELLRTGNGSFAPSLVLSAALLVVGAVVLSRLRDPQVMRHGEEAALPAARVALADIAERPAVVTAGDTALVDPPSKSL